MLNKYRRIIAFIIDMFIISMLTVAISSNVHFNPYRYDAEDYYDEYANYEVNYDIKDTSSLNKTVKDLAGKVYNLEKSEVFVYGWYLGFYILYMIVFGYFMEGQTLGKKLMRLKIVKSDGTRVGIKNLILRGLTNGSSLFMGTNFILLTKIIGTLLLRPNSAYIIYYVITSMIAFAIEFANIFMFGFGNSDLCLNDKISQSKVIYLRKKDSN